jgi:hypothetical protein
MKRKIKELLLGLSAAALLGICPTQLMAQAEETANLRRHAEELERHLMELREHGNRDEARAVQAELQEVGARLRELQNQPQERRRESPEAWMMKVRELRDRAREMQAAGREEAARDLAEQAERVQRELAEQRRPRARETAPSPLERELREVITEARRRAAGGNHEAAQELQRRAAEIREELQARRMHEGERKREGAAPGPEEIERRLHHVRVAMENLHAAGLPDVAHHLEEVAADLERALHRGGPGRDPIHHLQAQIEELRGVVGRLAEQMERLKHAVAEELEEDVDREEHEHGEHGHP